MIEIILNPTAGNGRSLEIGEAVAAKLKALGKEFVIHKPENSDDATKFARESAQRGAETVIAIGGDGTIHKVASGLRGTKTALGIIPAGTGNDFIKSAGIPQSWEEALDFLLSHPARPVDVGMVNDGFFMNECGTGFDVLTLDYAAEAKRFRGLIPYMYGVLRAIFTYKPVEMHLEIGDDVVLDGKYLVCAIANGSYIGGGMPIAPGADISDGMLDILVVDAVPNWVIPFYLPSLMMGTLHKKKRVAHRYLAPYCTVKCDNMRLNLDGEIVPMKEARFVCEPGSLLLHW